MNDINVAAVCFFLFGSATSRMMEFLIHKSSVVNVPVFGSSTLLNGQNVALAIINYL